MIELSDLAALTCLGRIEFQSEAEMRAAEMVASAPPLEMGFEFGGELSGSPGATGEGGDTLPQGQVEPFDESGIDGTGEAELLKRGLQVVQGAKLHLAFDLSELAAAIGFLDLTVEQVEGYQPFGLVGEGIRDPVTEVSGESIEIQV